MVKYVRFNELSCYIEVIFHNYIITVTGVITENVHNIQRTSLSQLYTALLSLLSILSFGISVIFIFIFLLWAT